MNWTAIFEAAGPRSAVRNVKAAVETAAINSSAVSKINVVIHRV